MQSVTNLHDVPLAAAVWLVNDQYDYIADPTYISATSLLKPIRQIIIGERIPEEEREVQDIIDFFATKFGSSIHDSIEAAWKNNYEKCLRIIGVPESVISRFVINPTDEQLKEDKSIIPVWMEIRTTKEIDGFKVGGKFDFIADYVLHDFKTSTVFSWIYGTRDEDYRLQGSIYRWLNPDKVKSDYIRIVFFFKDWSKNQAATNPKYPPAPIGYKDIPLMSIEETEQWVKNKLAQITKFRTMDEAMLPLCTKDELWMSDPVYKYYSKPESAAQGKRATKNFDSYVEATKMQMEKGGVVITEEGKPKRCEYCPVSTHCSQFKEMNKDD